MALPPDSKKPRLNGNEIVICQLHPSNPWKTDKESGRKIERDTGWWRGWGATLYLPLPVVPHHWCPYLKTATLAWLKWHRIQMWTDMTHWLTLCRFTTRWDFSFELHDVTNWWREKKQQVSRAGNFVNHLWPKKQRTLQKSAVTTTKWLCSWLTTQYNRCSFPICCSYTVQSVSIWAVKYFYSFLCLGLISVHWIWN